MPPKPANPNWKTGEQLEFLMSRWDSFKRAQNAKTLDHFWPKVFEDWYTRWPVPSSATLIQEYGTMEEGRLALQSEKNGQIKSWFNNRCRGTDTLKVSRMELKLDVNEKRKLAPVQAFCTYAWNLTLRPIVLARWEQQKNSTTFADDEDPPEGDTPPEERCIPLAFKLKIAKELYEKLSKEQKHAIDIQREEERKKLYRRVTEIDDDNERHQKLLTHKKNQPLVAKALNRVLNNLEDQSGCVAFLIIASVKPTGGPPSIQKFCQGETPHGVKFEDFYGDDWEENVENKFREWGIRVFGEKRSERRRMFLLPDSGTSSGSQTKPEASSSQIPPTEAAPSRKSTSQPSRSRKSVPQPPTPKESTSLLPVTHASSPTLTPTAQAVVTPDPPRSSSVPVPDLPVPHTSIDSLTNTPNVDEDMALLTTETGVHQAVAPQVAQEPHVVTSGNPDTIAPSELVVNQSQSTLEDSQSVAKPSQSVVKPSQSIAEPSQVAEPSQSVPKCSTVSVEVVPMDKAKSTNNPVPLQPLTKVVGATSSELTPKVSYRVRDPAAMSSGKPSRQGSIDGAPEMAVDAIDVDQEMTVDLSDYINIELDDNTSDVSSSQKTADGGEELLPPPPDSQQRHTSIGTTEGESESASSRTYPQLDIDEGDLPAWMVKKGQWRYVASTAGGLAWENLLKVYMNQERRLEFTEMGATLTNEDRPLKIREYFQYAHQPSRGDTLTVPDIGAEVAKWWRTIQPEWRRSRRDSPESPSQWAYILSGGSKGAFLIILCLAWWDRAYERHLEKQKKARQVEAETAGGTAKFDDLPDHDAEWLGIVNDVAFVMQKARNCNIPTRGMPGPGREGKRKRQDDSVPSKQAPTVTRSSRKKAKV